MTRLVRLFVAIAALAALCGCAWDQGIRPFWTLHDADFRQLKPGMTKADVEARVGKPIEAITFVRMGEEVWDYSFLDGQIHMRAYVYFDMKGIFKHHTESYDQAYYSGTDM